MKISRGQLGNSAGLRGTPGARLQFNICEQKLYWRTLAEAEGNWKAVHVHLGSCH